MTSQSQLSTAETKALHAYINLMRAAESTTSRIHSYLAKAHLTTGQFGALEALYHLGPMRQNELAAKVLRTAGNMTTVLDNLARRNLIRRQRETDDRRCITVHLTAAGDQLIAALFPEHARRVAEEFRILTPAEQQELRRLCRKLGRQES